MTIMDILNNFNLKLVNVGIIHQKLEEIVGQINILIISFLFFLDTSLLDATKPNLVFGLTTATDIVIISCDLLSEKLFLKVQNGEKHTENCEPRISEKHPCPD